MQKVVSILLSMGLMAGVFSAYGQLDPLYSQYHFNQYMINPAFGGLYSDMSFALNSRAQWFGLEGAPITNTFSATSSIGQHAGAGFRVMNDQLGIRTSTEVAASVSYFIESDFLTIGMGLQGGLTFFHQDLGKLDPKVVNDAVFDDFVPSYTRPNFGVGFVIQRFDYSIGLSVPRILNMKTASEAGDRSRYQRQYYLSGAYRFSVFRSYDCKVNTLIRVLENRVSVDLAGTYMLTDDLWAGMLFRDFSSISFFGRLRLREKYRFGYSFELPANNLITTNFGTHEISVSYTIAPLKGQRLENRFF